MFEADYPVLCGGTFFTLVLEARKPGRSSRSHTKEKKDDFREKDVLGALVKIVIPELKKDISPPSCSEFKRCKKNLSAVAGTDSPSTHYEAFNERVKTQYTSVLDAMETFTEKYISEDTYVKTRCAERLLDLIRKDESIQENEIFYVHEHGQALKKDALAEAKLEIYFPGLLLGIWHFVVIHGGDNRRGAATFENWHKRKSNSKSRSRWEFTSDIGNCYNGEISIRSKRFEDFVDSDLLQPDADNNSSQSSTANDTDIHIPQSGTAEIAVPQECRICLCCKDWRGNVDHAAITRDGRYGECDARAKRVLSTTDCCDRFRPDYGRISRYQVLHSLRIWKRLW